MRQNRIQVGNTSLVHQVGWWCASALGAGALAVAVAWVLQGAWIGTGFFAKQLCSGVFVSGRNADGVVQLDLKAYIPPLVFRHIHWSVDKSTGAVRARWLNGLQREARYRGSQGCVLLYDEASTAKRSVRSAPPARSHIDAGRAVGESAAAGELRDAGTMPVSISERGQMAALQSIVDQAFEETNRELTRATRAVVVVHRGRIVAERYAPGFDRTTRFQGWSLSKSVMNALVGALVQQGLLEVTDRVPVAAWRKPGDARAELTFDNLLRMSSGLKFDENYDSPFRDVTRMLFGARSASAFAESRPLIAQPGEVWSYASGSTSILADALYAYAGPGLAYHDMPRQLVFDRLDMRSALMESDASGNFESTASVYATARDWARFGELYAADGVWNGVRILPEHWVQYTTTPSASDPSGRYGAHFWIYTAAERMRARLATGVALPSDAFYAEGFAGQRITIIPSRDLVIVRLGNTPDERGFDNTLFAARVLGTFGPSLSNQQVRVSADNPG